MMGKFAWVKLVADNWGTIFKLVKEAVFGRKARRPKGPAGEVTYEEVVPEQVSAGD
jgi:hypothetical protein